MSRSAVNVGKRIRRRAGCSAHPTVLLRLAVEPFDCGWTLGVQVAGVHAVCLSTFAFEVDADPLEEVVVERDEADFDRDLQILQAAQLLEQSAISSWTPCVWLMTRLRLVGKGRISAWPPPFSAQVSVRDGRDDQVDERIEVGIRCPAHAARTGADGHRRRRRAAWIVELPPPICCARTLPFGPTAVLCWPRSLTRHGGAGVADAALNRGPTGGGHRDR